MEIWDQVRLKETPLEYARELSIPRLRRLLEWLKDLYYNQGQSPVSDLIYDQMDQIYEDKTGKKMPVGAVVRPDDPKVKLPCYMGSLDKGYPHRNRISQWLQTHPGPYLLSQKLDGIAVELVYDGQGHIRGVYKHGRDESDGQTGIDISFIIPFLGLPDAHPDYVIRGELIMSETKFKRYREEMTCARSMVVGLTGIKHLREHRRYEDLDVIVYEIMSPRMLYREQFSQLTQMGFQVAEHELIPKISVEDLTQRFAHFRQTSD